MKKAAVLSILVVAVLLTVGVIAEAQQTAKIFRIGLLDPHGETGTLELSDDVGARALGSR